MVGDPGHQEPVRQLVVVPDADLDDEVRQASRALVFEAFGDRFTRDDWDHATGGWRIVLLDGSAVVAHAAVVPRRLMVGRSPVAAGYVEAVATRRELQGTGAGSAVMAAVAGVIGSEFELGALSTSRTSFYARLGWESWRGPSYVRNGSVVLRTAEEDAGLMVLRFGELADVDLTSSITCDSRAGDDW
jgi:aminoglycoside 2'-N-acetyltransferase I